MGRMVETGVTANGPHRVGLWVPDTPDNQRRLKACTARGPSSPSSLSGRGERKKNCWTSRCAGTGSAPIAARGSCKVGRMRKRCLHCHRRESMRVSHVFRPGFGWSVEPMAGISFHIPSQQRDPREFRPCVLSGWWSVSMLMA